MRNLATRSWTKFAGGGGALLALAFVLLENSALFGQVIGGQNQGGPGGGLGGIGGAGGIGGTGGTGGGRGGPGGGGIGGGLLGGGLGGGTTFGSGGGASGGGMGGGGGLSSGGSSGAGAGTSSGMFGSRTTGSGISAGKRGFSGNGMLQGNERFLRNSRRGQFVGADSSDLRNILGGSMAGQNNNRRGNNNLGGRGAFGNNFNNNQDKAKKAVQTRTKVGFEAAGPSDPQLSAALSRRLNRSNKLRTVSPVEVEVLGGTAVLRGVVATDHDRALAEQVALLEAGIGQVQNELVLPSESSAPSLNLPREF